MIQTRLSLKRLEDGEHGVFDGDNQVGVIGHKHLMDHAKACMDDGAATLCSRLIKSATLAIDRELVEKTKRLIEAEGLTYGRAMRKVFSSDKDLMQRYRIAHCREIGEG